MPRDVDSGSSLSLLPVVKTFSVQTLGCKVNQYEGEQLTELLRARGLEAAPADRADLRIVHTCSVTIQAASKSRQMVRRAMRNTVALPVLESRLVYEPVDRAEDCPRLLDFDIIREPSAQASARPRVVVSGCWATSDREAAAALPGVDAVLTHRQDVAAELDRLLALWRSQDDPEPTGPSLNAAPQEAVTREPKSGPLADDGWISEAGSPAGRLTHENKARIRPNVNENLVGTSRLPVLGSHQASRQRAFLKIQDGCDAHCTYCIIPSLRPGLWSKPVDAVVDEAKALVDAGHVEIVLTGIFLGAYGQPTALRRRQPVSDVTRPPLSELIAALCTRVPGLRRLRLSSLEPGDLTPALLDVLRDHAAVVPHFHLPLQSGSARLLRRMNRQYTRDDFLRMVDRVNDAFDRPALTTDVIVGFPGETDEAFQRTVEVVDHARFIHVHAFSFSPRPGTAAARWTREFVRGPVVNQRIEHLTQLARAHDYAFRQRFLGETVELLVEQANAHSPSPGTPGEGRGEGLQESDISNPQPQISEDPHPNPLPAYREREQIRPTRHGRCERYFDVTIPAEGVSTGDFVRARIVTVTPDATYGEVLR